MLNVVNNIEILLTIFDTVFLPDYNDIEVVNMQIYDGTKDKKFTPSNHTVSVISANRIAHGENDHMTMRKNGREDWSLFYCESGCLYFDDQALKPGNIWIYPPRVPQRYIAYGRDRAVYRYLHFTGIDVEKMLTSLEIPFRSPIEIAGTSVLNALDNIQLAGLDDSPLSKLRAEYYTLYLISQIASHKKQVSKAGAIKRVMDDMEHAFAGEYKASYYADLLNVSESRFNHLFKEQTGQSPYTFFINLRIENAAALLEGTDLKIKDVAQQCGFEDPWYFTQAFKRIRGLTPSQYRKLNRSME